MSVLTHLHTHRCPVCLVCCLWRHCLTWPRPSSVMYSTISFQRQRVSPNKWLCRRRFGPTCNWNYTCFLASAVGNRRQNNKLFHDWLAPAGGSTYLAAAICNARVQGPGGSAWTPANRPVSPLRTHKSFQTTHKWKKHFLCIITVFFSISLFFFLFICSSPNSLNSNWSTCALICESLK